MKLIHEAVTVTGLKRLRRYVFGIWFFIVLLDPLTVIHNLPVSAFKPAGLLLRALPDSVEPWLLTETFLHSLRFAMLLFLLLAAIGIWMKTASFLAWGGFSCYRSCRFSRLG